MKNLINNSIVFFDGNCKLCNSSVNFILSRDSVSYFKFSPLTSEFSKNFFNDKKINLSTINSIILFDNGLLFSKSDAILRIIKKLNTPLKYCWYLKYIPKSVRDFLYDFIANNRYSWFGKQTNCMIHTKENLSKFL